MKRHIEGTWWVGEMNEKRYLNNNNNYTIKKIARSVEAIDFR
jgi:hypothetical protein